MGVFFIAWRMSWVLSWMHYRLKGLVVVRGVGLRVCACKVARMGLSWCGLGMG